jgi:hypothetical protein
MDLRDYKVRLDLLGIAFVTGEVVEEANKVHRDHRDHRDHRVQVIPVLV